MATRTITGGTSNDTVIINNSIDTLTGAPSRNSASVTIQVASDVGSVTINPSLGTSNANYLNVNLGAGDDVLSVVNMPWARDGINALDSVNMGAGE